MTEDENRDPFEALQEPQPRQRFDLTRPFGIKLQIYFGLGYAAVTFAEGLIDQMYWAAQHHVLGAMLMVLIVATVFLERLRQELMT